MSASGDFVIPLSDGAELAKTALLDFAQALRDYPDAAIVYGDEDRLSRDHRRHLPWFKPRWNAEMILAIDYISRSSAMRTSNARRAVEDQAFLTCGTPYALLLAITRDDDLAVSHFPRLVANIPARTLRHDRPARMAAVSARLEGTGATVEPGPHLTVTVRWPAPDPAPDVAILVPTRDRVDLVRACVESILALTQYPRFRIVILDNGSVEADTFDYFSHVAQDRRIEILTCAMPYNFSAINNFAVDRIDAAFLCFLNNDTQVIAGDWLGEMMRYAARPEVGAVGAQLLYEDRSIQHAGVVMGLGNAAGHAHRGLAAGDAGYFSQAHAAHYASAVTAACMVLDRRKFQAVGGFDAEHFAIAYNDVDLCLKLEQRGWHNVYAPQACVLHLESRSRGADLSPMHIDRYMRELTVLQQRWDTERIVDPMHHPALDRGSETYRKTL